MMFSLIALSILSTLALLIVAGVHITVIKKLENKLFKYESLSNKLLKANESLTEENVEMLFGKTTSEDIQKFLKAHPETIPTKEYQKFLKLNGFRHNFEYQHALKFHDFIRSYYYPNTDKDCLRCNIYTCRHCGMVKHFIEGDNDPTVIKFESGYFQNGKKISEVINPPKCITLDNSNEDTI